MPHIDGPRDRSLAILFDIQKADVHVYHLASFADLVGSGVSEGEDVRIFEIGWKGSEVSVWVEHPLFLTDDASLLGKWADLYADLAQRVMIKRSTEHDFNTPPIAFKHA